MVVSTNCRRCRSHIEIRDGKVVSTESTAKPALGPPPELRPAPPPSAPPPPPPIRTRNPDQESTPSTGTAEKKHIPKKPRRPPLLSRLRRSLTPEPKTRAVLCDRCQRKFTAPVAANATNCPGCGAYLHLHNLEIDEAWEENIRTCGNVVVLRRGSVSDIRVECHDFTLLGSLNAEVQCTGTFTIRRSGLIRGKIRCAVLRIERRAKVEFIYPVETGTATILGSVTGSIRATGTVSLLKGSSVRGNITTPNLLITPGATHTGLLRQPQKP